MGSVRGGDIGGLQGHGVNKMVWGGCGGTGEGMQWEDLGGAGVCGSGRFWYREDFGIGVWGRGMGYGIWFVGVGAQGVRASMA